MQQLGLGELPAAQQVTDGEGIAVVVFRSRQLIAFAMLLHRVSIDHPVGDMTSLQVSCQKLPEVVGRFHAHQHGRGLLTLLDGSQATVEIVVSVDVVRKPKPVQAPGASIKHNGHVAVRGQVYSDEQRPGLDASKSL